MASSYVRRMTSGVWLMLAVAAVSQADAQWGTVKGQVTVTGTLPTLPVLVRAADPAVRNANICAAVDIPNETFVADPKTGGLANVLVFVVTRPANIHPDLETSLATEVTLRIKGCRFVPHFLLVRTDQKVRVISEDPVAHNVHTSPMKNQEVNMIIAKQEPEGIVLPPMNQSERLPFRVRDDIHPWMSAQFMVLDHPYAAITNERGEFEIPVLPEGDHELRVWHERIGYIERSMVVTVKKGLNLLPAMTVAAERFQK
jgi:hypothetical protein